MSVEVIRLLQETEAVFRGMYRPGVPDEVMRGVQHAHSKVYCTMRSAGIDPLPYR